MKKLMMISLAALAAIVFTGCDESVAALLSMPERHKPKTIMGRDCWRELTKFYEYTWSGKLRGTDRPPFSEQPCIKDVIPAYTAFRQPPKKESGYITWPKLEQNFNLVNGDNPSLEIIRGNPDPTRPFVICNWAERRGRSSWGSEPTLDREDYNAWRTAHPNLLTDGRIGEWCNDLKTAYRQLENKNAAAYGAVDTANLTAEREAAFRKCLGNRPTNRYEQVATLRKYYKMRQERQYGGTMAVLDAHLNTLHIAGDCGASLLCIETTRSGQYRYQPTAMFTRGAARQFDVPWEWYVAGYVNAWSKDGAYIGAMCRYPTEEDPDGVFKYGNVIKAACWPGGSLRIKCGGPDGGISRTLFKRVNYLAYLAGANMIALEEWRSVLAAWDKEKNATILSPRGEIYRDFADFITRHKDRGAHYSPVAVCVPLAQGYPAWGGSAFDNRGYDYTEGDKAVDAVFYTLVPGLDYGKLQKEGGEAPIRNSKWADMYDVISPDVESQSAEELYAVMKSYKALIIVGEYKDRAWEALVKRFESEDGKVVRVDNAMLAEQVGKGHVMDGAVKFPALERELAKLQEEFFPFRVEGECSYGLSVADDHVWLYIFNNAGVTKYADAPQVLDVSKTAKITVTSKGLGHAGRVTLPTMASVREITTEKNVATDGRQFTWTIAPGDLAVFEIR